MIVMKQRTTNNNNNYKGKWHPQYPSDGKMIFQVEGFVQQVKSTENVDYITFNVDNPYVRGNYNAISVEVGHDLPMLEQGDVVRIVGNIRSWWTPDGNFVKYTFIAERIDEIAASNDDESEYMRQNERLRALRETEGRFK